MRNITRKKLAIPMDKPMMLPVVRIRWPGSGPAELDAKPLVVKAVLEMVLEVVLVAVSGTEALRCCVRPEALDDVWDAELVLPEAPVFTVLELDDSVMDRSGKEAVPVPRRDPRARMYGGGPSSPGSQHAGVSG